MFPVGVFLLYFGFGGMTRQIYMTAGPTGQDFQYRMIVFAFWVSSLLVGGICVGVRRLVEKRRV